MDLFATLRKSGGIEALARQLGHSPATVFAASDALVPEILACLREYVRERGGGDAGVQSLLAILNRLGDGQLAADVMGPDQVQKGAGFTLLEQICGKEAISVLAGRAADKTDLDLALLKDVLPLLAMLACGYISARIGSGSSEDGLDWVYELLGADKKI